MRRGGDVMADSGDRIIAYAEGWEKVMGYPLPIEERIRFVVETLLPESMRKLEERAEQAQMRRAGTLGKVM